MSIDKIIRAIRLFHFRWFTSESDLIINDGSGGMWRARCFKCSKVFNPGERSALICPRCIDSTRG